MAVCASSVTGTIQHQRSTGIVWESYIVVAIPGAIFALLGSIGVARKLRQTSTIPEVKLWQYLRNRQFMGLKFRRQFPVGPYVVDFVCLSHKLVIELDGGQHAEQLDYDNQRTEYIAL